MTERERLRRKTKTISKIQDYVECYGEREVAREREKAKKNVCV